MNVEINSLDDLIGLPPFDDTGKRELIPGLGVGLAYNGYGGSIMYIEIVPTSHALDSSAEVFIDTVKPTSLGSLRVTG